MNPSLRGFVPLLLVLLPGIALARRPSGENVHRWDSSCRLCHTAESTALTHNPTAARTLVTADFEAHCPVCHGDQGPSHPTGLRPAKPVTDELPLSGDRRITCATCHFMHGERDPFGDFLRIDNRRGALCLSCHELSELER